MRQYWGVGLLFALVTLGIGSIWAYWAGHSEVIHTYWTAEKSAQNAAFWGDAFGGFNALFGALGFAAVLATITIQIRSSIDQQKDQHRQRFDATFFEMLRIIKDLRSELQFQFSRDYVSHHPSGKNLSEIKKGRDAIPQATQEMRFWIGRMRGARSTRKQKICDAYMTYVHGRYENRLGPYFRMLYTVMFKIKSDTVLSKKEKIYYGNILRSQLNQFEISLMAMNAASPISGDLAILMTEFRMLKYLPKGVTRNALQCYFPAETFEARDD